MPKLIYIEASPRKTRSASINAAQAFLEAYRSANPEDEVTVVDLWSEPLPEMDGPLIDARYKIMRGKDHDPEEAESWDRVVKIFERFAAADKYLFSLPMWNFGVPYRLKHYIDIVSQPGLSFTVTEAGYKGLVSGKPATVIYARGGDYRGERQPFNFQSTYFETWLQFIGFTDIRSIVIEPTLAGGPEKAQDVKEESVERARSMGADF